MSIEITQIQNPIAFSVEGILKLIDRACTTEHFPAAPDLIEFFKKPGMLQRNEFIIAEESESGWSGIAIMQNAPWVLSEKPWVLLFYAESSDTKIAMLHWIVSWMKENGIETIRAINHGAVPDEDYIQLFDEVVDGEVVGSVIDFTVRD